MAKDLGWLMPDPLDGYDLLCVTLKIPNNLEYRAAFMGALHMLEVWFNWEKTGDTRAAQAAAYWRDLLETYLTVSEDDTCGGGDMPFLLRQNPDNFCQLQQSIDGGETWTLAYDYSECIPPWGQSLLTSASTGGVVVINPAAPTVTFTSQPGDTNEQKQARVDGLCYASSKIVASMMDAAFKVCDGTATGLNLAGLTLGIITVILIGVEIISAGSLTALVMVAFAAMLEIAGQIKALSCDVWLDTDTRDQMTCFMFQNLMNRGVTLENFRLAFSGYECLTGDAHSVAQVLNSTLQSPAQGQALFDNFLNVLGEAQSGALQGATIESCICEAETWCFVLTPDNWSDFTWGDHVEFPCGTVYGGDQSGQVAGSPGSRYWGDKSGHSSFQLLMSVFIPSNATLESVLMTYDVGTATNDNTGKRVTANSSVTCNTSGGFSPYGFSSGLGLTGSVNLSFGLINNMGKDDQKLTAITLSGTGTNPFAACDNC